MRRIAHLSDLHFGRHDPVVVDGLLASLAEARPDLVLVSGDLTQRARRAEFAAARAFLDRLAPVPTVVIPGNHDIPLYDLARRFVRPLHRFRRLIGCETHAFFADAELAVLGLNTARSLTFKNGRISFAQMNRIRRAFADVPSGALRVLAVHHPLAPPAHDPDLDPVGRWRPALEAIGHAGVQVVLSGHFHSVFSGGLAMPMRPADGVGGCILAVHAGTAVSTRTRGGEANSYNLIRTEGDRALTVAVQAWDGRRFAEGPCASFERRDGRWRRTGVEPGP